MGAINIACGGHAGNPAWSRELAARALDHGVRVHLHPGYPDRAGFGRRPMDISWTELANSLREQRAVLPDTSVLKLHGALYNKAAHDACLAEQIADWCVEEGIREMVTMPETIGEKVAKERGITVLREAFADRRYVQRSGGLALQSRSDLGAVLHTCTEVVAQARSIVEQQCVTVADGRVFPVACDTICLHGDGPDALVLAQALKAWQETT